MHSTAEVNVKEQSTLPPGWLLGRTGPGQTAAPELENSSRRTASKSMQAEFTAELTEPMDGRIGCGACGGGDGVVCLAGTGSGGFACDKPCLSPIQLFLLAESILYEDAHDRQRGPRHGTQPCMSK